MNRQWAWRLKPGNLAGDCAVCGVWGCLCKHHSKPSTNGRNRSGPIWLLCTGCHEWLHRNFTNSELRWLPLGVTKQLRDWLT